MWFSIKFVGTEFVRLEDRRQARRHDGHGPRADAGRLVAREPWQVELDLSRLRMIDTIGVGALIRFYKRLRMGGCHLTISGLHDQPLTVFRLLRLDERLGDFGLEPRWS